MQPIQQGNSKCTPSLVHSVVFLFFFLNVFTFWAELQWSLLPCGPNNLQKENEDLDDVDVEGKGSKHVLIFRDRVLPVSYQKLCVVGQELHSENIHINNVQFKISCLCTGLTLYSPMWKRWFPKLRKACEATEPATIIKIKQQWRHHDVGDGTTASTGATTYVFKGQDYGGNEAGHKNYNSQDAEKTLALGEVHLWRERTCLTCRMVQMHNGRYGSPPSSGSRRLWRRCRRPLWWP